MTDHERKIWGLIRREHIPASEVPLLAVLLRYFRRPLHEKKEMNPQETIIFEAALRYYEVLP